jgi:putative flippase GtrA
LETGGICTDTQTGLRGIPKGLFNLALETAGERYEYEMNFLLSVGKAGYAIEMEDIETVYENGNRGSHFRPIKDSYRIYRTMFNYVFASLACALIDLGLFHIFTLVIDKSIGWMLLQATVSARIISGIVNFLLNKFFSFRKKKHTVSQIFKYGALFIFQMTLSWLLVWSLSGIGVAYVFIKAVVDTILFCFSYYTQRKWVFKNEIS